MEKAPVSAKGQIQLPAAFREKYGIEEGGLVLLAETDHGILITPLNRDFFDAFLGKYGNAVPSHETFAAWSAEELANEEQHLKHHP